MRFGRLQGATLSGDRKGEDDPVYWPLTVEGLKLVLRQEVKALLLSS
jgi:hypothetical protein